MPDAKRPVSCPKCGKRLSAPSSYEGRKLKCPDCATTFPCVFAGPAMSTSGTAAIMPPAGGFRVIDVPDANPKRSAMVELTRLALGTAAAIVGAIIGIVIWGVVCHMTGSVIGIIGFVIVGGATGAGMRLGYGRFGDAAAGVFAGMIAMASFFVASALLSEGGLNLRGLAACTGMAGAAAFCVAFGYGFDGNDID